MKNKAQKLLVFVFVFILVVSSMVVPSFASDEANTSSYSLSRFLLGKPYYLTDISQYGEDSRLCFLNEYGVPTAYFTIYDTTIGFTIPNVMYWGIDCIDGVLYAFGSSYADSIIGDFTSITREIKSTDILTWGGYIGAYDSNDLAYNQFLNAFSLYTDENIIEAYLDEVITVEVPVDRYVFFDVRSLSIFDVDFQYVLKGYVNRHYQNGELVKYDDMHRYYHFNQDGDFVVGANYYDMEGSIKTFDNDMVLWTLDGGYTQPFDFVGYLDPVASANDNDVLIQGYAYYSAYTIPRRYEYLVWTLPVSTLNNAVDDSYDIGFEKGHFYGDLEGYRRGYRDGVSDSDTSGFNTFGKFLTASLGAFFDTELFLGFSIGNVLSLLVGSLLFLYLLKLMR